ncbi:MAG: fibronectin type III domain-containing protein [Eubacterium sp.]|nr:fibronectin type III domain-containing protein [Eubacterium sp.]
MKKVLSIILSVLMLVSVMAGLNVTSFAEEHQWKLTDIDRATLGKDGKKYYTCEKCGDTKIVKIAKITSIKLSTAKYVYDGKVKTPKLVVTDANGRTLTEKCYLTGYDDGRKKVGTYSVDATLKGSYYGIFVREFKIVPKGTSIYEVIPGKKQMTVHWGTQKTQTTGYQLQYATNAKFTKGTIITVKDNTNTKRVVKNLTSGKKYYVRVRTYKSVDGETYRSAWSKVKYTTVK